MVVIKGLSGTLPLDGGATITSAMPPQQGLNDDATAAVVNYVFRLNLPGSSSRPPTSPASAVAQWAMTTSSRSVPV
ncbi:hypothetical protein [Bradyrhizobium sp. HKCCYLR20261]|uniref:hypothetical protein n=1 Tax=Bradyrhizobium sp. HKCCYLR20261 TaxID=3420760 RepID=UPI003EBA860C